MKPRTKVAAVVLLIIVGGALAFLVMARRALPGPLQLPNGTWVELQSITRGTNHVAWEGDRIQRLLRRVPNGLIPRAWRKPVLRRQIYTETNALVLWLRATGNFTSVLFGVTDADGFGAFQSGLDSLYATRSGTLHPFVLKEWPRHAKRIAITFFDKATGQHQIGRLVFQNPARVLAPRFQGRSLPASKENRDLKLSLVSLDVLPKGRTFTTAAGAYWACRARFQVAERGITNQDWVVQSMWLSDAAGNLRRATGPRQWKGPFFEIFSDPLWLDEGSWKVSVDLTRGTNFPPEETVTFLRVPVPRLDGPDQDVFATNLLGRRIVLASMRNVRVRLAPRSGFHSMGGPGFALELDPRDDEWVPKIAAIWNERGEPLPVPPHGYGEGYSLMRFRMPAGTGAKLLTIQVTVQQRRRFELFGSAKVISTEGEL